MSRETKYLDFVRKYLKEFKTERQRDSKETEEIKKKLTEIKKVAVQQEKQDIAKDIWCLEQILKIQEYYLNAFKILREGKFYDAWCELEQCEVRIIHLSRHFQIDKEIEDYGLTFVKKKVKQLQGLFPYKWFMSPEFVVLEQRCSICNKPISLRNSCGHVLGEIYDGDSCGREITNGKMVGVALTENPRNKYAVPFSKDSKTGKQIDTFDYTFLKYLISVVQSPFDKWSYHWTKIRHPHSRFKDIGKNDLCPCESGKKYKKCCLNEDGVLRPHLKFTLNKKPFVNLPEIIYTD